VQNINAFTNLIYVVKKMKILNEIYTNYPKSPTDGFTKWRAQVDSHMKEAKDKFQPNPI
jgi:digeranylgeranylglycerophospholipid reductase